MESGIYQIVNSVDGKRYIGRSNHLKKRWKVHEWMLKRNRHFNVHLQRAYLLNPNAFSFKVIEYCDVEKLNEKEIFYIKKYKTMDMAYGYNLCEGGNTTTGRKCSEETRRKISEKKTGYKCKREDVEKRARSLKEHIANDPEFARYHHEYCSKGAKGKPSWNKGRPCPEEKKKYLSKVLKGKSKMTDKAKKKMHELYKGENSLTAKTTENEVIDMRLRFLKGEPRMMIAKDYPYLHPNTVYDIVKGKRWTYLPNTIEELERLKNGTQKS